MRMRFTPAILTWIAAMIGLHDINPASAQSDQNGAEEIPVARFSASDLTGWRKTSFAGDTLYRLQHPAPGENLALHAEAKASASGYCRDIEIDLQRTPVVAWVWRMDQGPEGLDERSKRGDDHPLRLYFVHKAGLFGSASQAIEYIWSMSEPVGAVWPNPYARRVMQLVVDSGTEAAGAMQHHKRDLRDDFHTISGIDIDRIDTVCLMTDSDQSRLIYKGRYGDIIFINKP